MNYKILGVGFFSSKHTVDTVIYTISTILISVCCLQQSLAVFFGKRVWEGRGPMRNKEALGGLLLGSLYTDKKALLFVLHNKI